MIGSSGPDDTNSPSNQQTSSTTPGNPIDEEQQELSQLIEKWKEMTFEESQIPSLLESLKSTDVKKQCFGVIGFRKQLSLKQNPSIQEVLDLGLAPIFVKLMQSSTEPQIQFEAAWCLTNLCSGTSEQVKKVIDCGVVPCFISALHSTSEDLIEQSLWGLGNIAGDSAAFRDFVISKGAIEAMVNVLGNASGLSMKRNGIWALSNCCRGEPAPYFASISATIPLFCDFLKNEPDNAVLTDSAWGLFYNTSKSYGVEAVLSYDVASALVRHLSSSEVSLIIPCLRVVGNIISDTDEHTSVILKEQDLLPALLSLSTHEKKVIRKEVFWIISNITAGQPVQFEGIMGNPAFVERIIHAAKSDDEEVRKEAIYALSNSTSTGTPAQIIRLLNNGVFKCLIELLGEVTNVQVLSVVLEGIEKCLKWGKEFNLVDESGVNRFVIELEEQGGLEKIENLQKHQSFEVSEYVIRILRDYFETDEQNKKNLFGI